MTSTSGFARHHVEAFARVYGIDARAAYLGTVINDKLLVSLRESAARLEKVSMVGAREVLIVNDASKVYVWKGKLAKDGDTYERKSEINETTRGSLKALREAYGAGSGQVLNEAQVTKLLATKNGHKQTLAFYGLQGLAKQVAAKVATVAKKGAKAVKKTVKRVKVSAKK